MRDELTCWDALRHRGFTGQEAALAIVGEPETKDPATLSKTLPVLELMRECYEGTRRWFYAQGVTHGLDDSPANTDPEPAGLLVSEQMQAAQDRTTAELDAAGAGDVRFMTWLRTPMADFERQTFTREVLARWVQEVGASSLYPFTPHTGQEAPADERACRSEEQGAGDSSWTVNKPKRYRGYTAALHRFLAIAHREGKARPTAREILEEWRSNTPPEIAMVLPDGFDYYDNKGDTRAASTEALRQAINRMTSVR